MTRLTITLSDERHRALKEAALEGRKSIASLIEESLDFYGIKTRQGAEELVAKARARAGLSQEDAVDLVVEETRMARRP
jgi:predicted CopG family antitoxin